MSVDHGALSSAGEEGRPGTRAASHRSGSRASSGAGGVLQIEAMRTSDLFL
ncbi:MULTISPECIES: hypothetical protein [Nocardioides]|uniref:Uncharacterized protein n=1 Tax=Nocardioides vastitatis TaxID=2568655 RepID=A0ABW0ZST9_9ACTN|nr:hypothetical protein [Nocardioides sp.]